MSEPQTPFYRAIRLCDLILVLKNKNDTLLDLDICKDGQWVNVTDMPDEEMDRYLENLDTTKYYVTEIIPYYNADRGIPGIHIAASDEVEMYEFTFPVDSDLLEDKPDE